MVGFTTERHFFVALRSLELKIAYVVLCLFD